MGTFSVRLPYKTVRGWTSSQNSLIQNFVEYVKSPPSQPGRIAKTSSGSETTPEGSSAGICRHLQASSSAGIICRHHLQFLLAGTWWYWYHNWSKEKIIEVRKVKLLQKLGAFATAFETATSIISGIAPVFRVFSRIAFIARTFLAPNPFDELATYLDDEFKQITNRLTDIQADIADLGRLTEAKGGVLYVILSEMTVSW